MKTKEMHIVIRDEGIVTDGSVDVSVRCLDCLYLDEGYVTCTAFPDGIPNIILNGEFDHKDSFDGDNDIQFEPLK